MLESINFTALLYNLGKLSGTLSLICLAFLIVSGDMARYFDRFIGIDKIIKFQRKFALITLFFVFLHPFFFMLSYKSVINFLIPNFAVVPLALGIFSFYFIILTMLASFFYKRVSYISWQFIHILTYITFFFGLYHAINWGSSANEADTKFLYATLSIFIVIGTIYRTIYKIRQHYKQKFIVDNIKAETNDTFTLSLIPSKDFKFKSGQFCFLRINKNHLHARHPFTISSAPQNKTVDFTMKDYGGRFTQTAKQLSKGEEVLVDGPFGIFTAEHINKDLVFIAGGVGITPFMSMIKDRLNKNTNQKITLLYGSKNAEDNIFKNEIDNISKDWFKKIYIYSQEKKVEPTCESGYINKEIIEKYITNHTESIFYICGPTIMKKNVIECLKELNVKSKNIIVEDFFW